MRKSQEPSNEVSLLSKIGTLESDYWQLQRESTAQIATLVSQIEELEETLRSLTQLSSLGPAIPLLNQKWLQEDSEIQKLVKPILVRHLEAVLDMG